MVLDFIRKDWTGSRTREDDFAAGEAAILFGDLV
jgi:hypothetical protein